MKNLFEFFSSTDPDSQFLFMSIEGLCSILVSILVWMLIDSAYINIIFPVTVGICTIAGGMGDTWKEKLKIMTFIAISSGILQFGISIFILNKILILIFIFLYTIVIFSIPNYQIYAGLSLFPGIIALGNLDFSYAAALNRGLYQICAIAIAFFIAVFFSIITSKCMIRRSIISYLYFLNKRFEYFMINNKPLSGLSSESQNLLQVTIACMKNSVQKEYLLLSQQELALNARGILFPLLSISRGLLLLKKIDYQDKTVSTIIQFIENNLNKIISDVKKNKRICISNLEVDIQILKANNNNFAKNKNIYALLGIVSEIQKLDGKAIYNE